jgi:cytochrome c oxidase cbb3-type subunit III
MPMRTLPLRITLAVSLVASLTIPLRGQATAPPSRENVKNPFAGDLRAITQGQVLFRQECVFCHGVGARGGVRGPDLTTGSWTHGGSDAELSRTIRSGVPGTAMPANRLTDDETWEIVAYLRTVQQPPAPPIGDAARGETLFFAADTCSSCHMVRGRGGRLGPELSHIGSARPRAYLLESIREPNRQLSENRTFEGVMFDTVTAQTQDGRTIVGVTMNEDTFTVQIMDTSERVHSFEKKSLKNLRHENRSLMPAYGPNVLNDAALQDLVAYLQSLRAPTPVREKGTSDANR